MGRGFTFFTFTSSFIVGPTGLFLGFSVVGRAVYTLLLLFGFASFIGSFCVGPTAIFTWASWFDKSTLLDFICFCGPFLLFSWVFVF